MGNAQDSGQLIAIQNDTKFVLNLCARPQVICGRTLDTPSEIPASNAANIKNSGIRGCAIGSEIWYQYQFVGTPGESVWRVKIFSEGAYRRENAKCVVQVLEDDTLTAQESLWDRDNGFPRKRTPQSRFRLSRLQPKFREDLGDGFYEIAVKITEEHAKSTPESKDDDHKPAESNPAENKPAESKLVEKMPVESKPAENIPPESKPESKDEDHKPAESKPAENKPAENKPAESKPAESKPAENIPPEIKPKSKDQDHKSVESKPAEMTRDVNIVVHNTTRHVVECSTEHPSQGKWVQELPKRIDAREKATAKACDVTAKGEPVFKLKIAGQKAETSWLFNFDETDSGFKSGEQELEDVIIQPSSYHNHEGELCGSLIVTESALPVFQELSRSLKFLVKPIHRKVIILAVVAALVLLVVGRMEWIGLALAPIIPGIAGEAARPMWKWFWDEKKERGEGVTTDKKAILNEQAKKNE